MFKGPRRPDSPPPRAQTDPSDAWAPPRDVRGRPDAWVRSKGGGGGRGGPRGGAARTGAPALAFSPPHPRSIARRYWPRRPEALSPLAERPAGLRGGRGGSRPIGGRRLAGGGRRGQGLAGRARGAGRRFQKERAAAAARPHHEGGGGGGGRAGPGGGGGAGGGGERGGRRVGGGEQQPQRLPRPQALQPRPHHRRVQVQTGAGGGQPGLLHGPGALQPRRPAPRAARLRRGAAGLLPRRRRLPHTRAGPQRRPPGRVRGRLAGAQVRDARERVRQAARIPALLPQAAAAGPLRRGGGGGGRGRGRGRGAAPGPGAGAGRRRAAGRPLPGAGAGAARQARHRHVRRADGFQAGILDRGALRRAARQARRQRRRPPVLRVPAPLRRLRQAAQRHRRRLPGGGRRPGGGGDVSRDPPRRSARTLPQPGFPPFCRAGKRRFPLSHRSHRPKFRKSPLYKAASSPGSRFAPSRRFLPRFCAAFFF